MVKNSGLFRKEQVRESQLRLAGWGGALFSSLAFSIGPPLAAAIITAGTDPTLLLVVRLWLANALLFGLLVLRSPSRLRLDARALLAVGVAGLATGASLLLFFWSLTRLDTSVASMLFALQPLSVLGLLALRGERFTYRQWVRTGLALAGVYLLVGPGGPGAAAGTARVDLVGVFMVLAAVGLAALQTVSIQWYLQAHDGQAVTAYMLLAMALTVSGWWLATGAHWQPLSGTALAGIAVLAIVPTYVARVLMFAAVRQLGSGQVALLAPLETLFTVAWSVFFLGDRLSLGQGLGGALILLSAALAVRRLGRAGRR